ncbi:phosphodiesterase/alkaline phosphatase D [Xenococcus sp. PCC 7305]|uniref:alkaline phosphatase D family protein n=1 Tax=Xenococcus sp. PCC 7305 TaxID=102125 RepID=UPI0002AC14FD|nr:alkaline phosphatase D family protein [Xenococcus sp. PCC 7305]ELS03442.1 phosphodiesterase/alkaline phosphatase D [Xenococcus sp. PCC 7305]
MAIAEWFWSGGITDSTVTIKAKISEPTQDVQIIYSPDVSLETGVQKTPITEAREEAGNIVSFTLDELQADTNYYYRVVVDEHLSADKGRFKTVQVNKPYTFSVGCSGCARGSLLDEIIAPEKARVSNNKIFDIIRNQTNPTLTFFIHLGDLHYRDIDDGDIKKYRKAYQDVFAQKRQCKLYQNLPIAYVWDDHDFTGNNSDGRNPGKYAASRAYREAVPHYPLIESLDEEAKLGGIYQSFIIGRVRFIITDGRFHRKIETVTDSDTGEQAVSMLGTRQREWLLQQLKEGHDLQGCTVWINSMPWIDKAKDDEDTWGGFASERKIIADFIKEHTINKLVMVSGDAHMLALDDGQNNSFASGGGGEFPVIQAASLASFGSEKGGPYQFGPFPGDEQWGILTFTDSGNQISLNVQLKEERNEVKIEKTFLFS